MSIDPKNVTAQMAYRAAGNPPSTLPTKAISNCFPGLEFDFRNVWRRILVGLELHEATNLVLGVEEGGPADSQGVRVGQTLKKVNGMRVDGDRVNPAGVVIGLTALEWSNSLADAVQSTGPVVCEFATTAGTVVTATLAVRPLFDGATVARDVAEPGELTQSLCSPWQADYRECGCFYWAASRPDYVNVEDPGTGAVGHSWMHRDRTATTAKGYIPDGTAGAPLVSYEDLYQAWEQHLRFVIGGADEL